MQETIFELPQTLESINGGCSRYDLDQVYPISGNVGSPTTYVGTGQATGNTVFQWRDNKWWSPIQSYFYLQLAFTKNATAVPVADGVAYVDNPASTLFTQVKTYVNSDPLDSITTPWIIDSALTYANSHKNFNDTFGTMSRIGESLMTRIYNVANNSGIVEVAFRPAVSLLDVALLPPGAQFKIEFTWASQANLIFEAVKKSISIGVGANDYNVAIQSFYLMKAVVTPGPNVEVPAHGVIELSPTAAMQYFANNTNTLRQNITLPATTNRILCVFQDNNPVTVSDVQALAGVTYSGVGNGFNPATSFLPYFSNSNGSAAYYIQQLYINLPELGVTEPNPTYNFTGIQDYMRAYADYCNITQGTKYKSEGSLPFGNISKTVGATIIGPTTPNTGDFNNPDRYIYVDISTALAVTAYNQTALYGWVGKKQIFAFPVVRPENKPVTSGTLNVTFTGSPTNAVATILATYSMALVVENDGTGLYNYKLVQGV